MRNLDLLRPVVSIDSMAAMSAPRRLLLGLRVLLLWVFLLRLDARLLQHVTSLFRAGLGPGQQEFAQPLQGDLSFAQ